MTTSEVRAFWRLFVVPPDEREMDVTRDVKKPRDARGRRSPWTFDRDVCEDRRSFQTRRVLKSDARRVSTRRLVSARRQRRVVLAGFFFCSHCTASPSSSAPFMYSTLLHLRSGGARGEIRSGRVRGGDRQSMTASPEKGREPSRLERWRDERHVRDRIELGLPNVHGESRSV